MYFSDTSMLKIAVIPRYKKDESLSTHDSSWEYSVFIENIGHSMVQLVSKYWYITCADGTTHEILGDASYEEKQFIEPGDVLETKNVTNLRTSLAIIKGHYVMISKGQEFDVEIPAFSLDNPYQAISIN